MPDRFVMNMHYQAYSRIIWRTSLLAGVQQLESVPVASQKRSSRKAREINRTIKMATSAFDMEIEKFIKPIRGLYKEYVTTIDKFLTKNEEMMENRIIISDSIRDGFLVYEMFGDGEEGEIIREKVQTWICDNRMDVTNAVSTTLRTKKVTFGDWFRSSEQNRSPDELIVYCLAKMSKRHTVIFNDSFPWSTLLNHMSYSDSEIVERSSVLLIYVGVSNYAIIQPKPKIPYNIGKPACSNKSKKATKKRTLAKTICRLGKRTATSQNTQPIRLKSRSRTLSEQRHERYGIGNVSPVVRSRTRQKKVDYLKLKHGLENPSETSMSPKPKRHRNYLPSRSGPSSARQKAQKIVTSPPAQLLPASSARRSINTTVDAISGVQQSDNDKQITIPNTETSIVLKELGNSTNELTELSGVQINDGNSVDQTQQFVSGVHGTLSGVRDVLLTDTLDTNSDTITNATQPMNSTKPTDDNATVNYPADTDTLPDLIVNSTNTSELDGHNIIPPIGDVPPEHLFDGATTEEEFDAVDALLSLRMVRSTTYVDNDDNSSLMPIAGSSRYVDVNPVPIQLDSTTVDGAIAQLMENEQNLSVKGIVSTTHTENPKGSISTDEETVVASPTPVEQSDEKTKSTPTNNYDAETELEGNDNEQSKKGYVKLTTHGIKKKTTTVGRVYRCTICSKNFRSARRLNIHHKRNHSAQMCGICGKIFELASSLTHHMYSHDERRYYCGKCSFHSHFESELKKHKITHHTTPQHQCMHHNCGRWFMRKADLVLHVETHKKKVFTCDFCDHTTTLKKYMKEHMKSHSDTLPYQCNICNKKPFF